MPKPGTFMLCPAFGDAHYYPSHEYATPDTMLPLTKSPCGYYKMVFVYYKASATQAIICGKSNKTPPSNYRQTAHTIEPTRPSEARRRPI
jgi:hypothetical protein